MHLAIDAVGNKKAGVATVLLDTLRAVEENPDVQRVTLFTSPRAVREYDLPPSEKVEEQPQRFAEHVAARPLWYELLLPRAVERCGADVLLCLHSAGESPTGVPHATFVERPLVYAPEAWAAVDRGQRLRMPVIRWTILRSCRTAARVFAHTRTEADIIARLADIDPQTIEVVLPTAKVFPPVLRPSPRLAGMRAVPDSCRLLFVGQLYAHKNVRVVIDALPILRARFPGIRLFVVGPEHDPLPASPDVEYLGMLSAEELGEAYSLATVLVMPSLHETIGLPMLEAMSLGTPVAAADRPYAREVCEDAAVFFDPLEPAAVADALGALLADGALREQQRRKGLALTERRRESRPYARLVERTLEVAGAGSSP